MHKQICNGTNGLCTEMARMNTSLLMHFLKSSRFTGITGRNSKLLKLKYKKKLFVN